LKLSALPWLAVGAVVLVAVFMLARPPSSAQVNTIVVVASSAHTEAYGPAPQEYGELRLPKGRGPFPVAVIIHGGCWTKGYANLDYMTPLAEALTREGVATWNIEYRQKGDPGGGWPGTFTDWGAATDHLRALAKAYPLDLSRVVVAGHSAGGHAALWIAARGGLPADSPIRGASPLKVAAAVDIDGPADLAGIVGRDAGICGAPVVAPFMGGTPAQVPDRYAQASPIARPPLHAAQYLISAKVLTPADGAAYRAAALAKGEQVDLRAFPDASHGDVANPRNPAGAEVVTVTERAANVINY
jgi:acetyl esterase/lipase